METTTNRYAWIAWDAEYPEDSGAVPGFTPALTVFDAQARANVWLGYDADATDAVSVQRAPHLDGYAAAGEVPEDVPLWPPPAAPQSEAPRGE